MCSQSLDSLTDRKKRKAKKKKVFKAKTKRNHNEKLWINIVYEKKRRMKQAIMHGLPASKEFATNVKKREHQFDARQFSDLKEKITFNDFHQV